MEGITITKKYTSGKTENMLEGQSEAGHEITTKKCHKRGSNTRVKHSFKCLLQILINGIDMDLRQADHSSRGVLPCG
jgi:hypothetical protein